VEVGSGQARHVSLGLVPQVGTASTRRMLGCVLMLGREIMQCMNAVVRAGYECNAINKSEKQFDHSL
jgi:hypothetical protein